MDYYDIEDIRAITGTSYSKSAEIVRNLNCKYQEEYPKSEIIRGKILKNYFNKSQGLDSKNLNVTLKNIKKHCKGEN